MVAEIQVSAIYNQRFDVCVSPVSGAMDYIREFDIRLEKEMYYAGETLAGQVILDTVENFKLRGERGSHGS